MKFDLYTWQARVFPSVLSIFPIILELNCVMAKFDLFIEISVPALTNTILMAFVFLMANWCRHLGRKKEKILFEKWNGPPTTRFLRYSDTEYNSAQKEQLREILINMFSDLSMPSKAIEKNRPADADKVYETYVNNLKGLTRDSKKFYLLHSENRNYGMWRNLYGLKTMSIVVLVFLCAINISLCAITKNDAFLIDSLMLNSVFIVIAILWLTIVTVTKIKDVAECYANRLFETVFILKNI